MPSHKHRSDTAMAGLSSREGPGSVADRKTEMCTIFDVYDKCGKGVKNDKGDRSDDQRKERSSG